MFDDQAYQPWLMLSRVESKQAPLSLGIRVRYAKPAVGTLAYFIDGKAVSIRRMLQRCSAATPICAGRWLPGL
jgi:hypothetical protein